MKFHWYSEGVFSSEEEFLPVTEEDTKKHCESLSQDSRSCEIPEAAEMENTEPIAHALPGPQLHQTASAICGKVQLCCLCANHALR
jgi:hypothetical protein